MFLFCASQLSAQIGGHKVFKSLNLSPSARVSGLGLKLITLGEEDVLLAYENPAVANPKMHKQVTFNHNFFLGGIKHGVVAVGYDVPKLAMTFHGGFRYLNYGDIPQTDVYGNKEGEIAAGEWAVQVGASKPLSEKWRMGMNLNFLNARLDVYRATGMTADAGFFYEDTTRRINLALVIKNVGTELSTFTEGENGKMPLDVSIGISKRLAHMPMRFSVTMHHLNQWDLTYNDPNAKDDIIIIGEDSKKSGAKEVIDNFFRHFVFSSEFLLGKYEQVRLRIGYNHLINRELSVKGLRGASGFTAGIGIKIKRFRIDYGYTNYHFGGKASHLALSSYF